MGQALLSGIDITTLGRMKLVASLFADYCFNKPCKNKGTCVDESNGFSCKCPVAYEGKTCEKEKGPGFHNPPADGIITVSSKQNDDLRLWSMITKCSGTDECTVKDRTTCTEEFHASWSWDWYETRCYDKYKQVACSKTDACSTCVLTKDGAGNFYLKGTKELRKRKTSLCKETVYDLQVKCYSNWKKNNGQILHSFKVKIKGGVNPCSRGPCLNGGTCSCFGFGNDDYSCKCAAGFTGRNCQININECASNPCKNNGKCKDGINKYTCDCHVSYKGSTCQTRKGVGFHNNPGTKAISTKTYKNSQCFWNVVADIRGSNQTKVKKTTSGFWWSTKTYYQMVTHFYTVPTNKCEIKSNPKNMFYIKGNTNVCWRGCGSGGRTCQSVGYKYHVKLACYHTSFTKDRGDQSAWFYVKIEIGFDIPYK